MVDFDFRSEAGEMLHVSNAVITDCIPVTPIDADLAAY
jgi:hypothetical protein